MHRSLIPFTLAALVFLPSCEVYDPPPSVELVIPPNGGWFSGDDLVLEFDEPIEPSSLRFSIWERGDLDIEGNLSPDAEMFAECTLEGGEKCAPMTLDLDEAGDTVAIHPGDAFDGWESRPFMLIIHAGLKDLQGRTVQVDRTFDFQVNAHCTGGNPVEWPLQVTNLLMVSDLGDILEGVFLRFYAEIVFDPNTGQAWSVDTLADVVPGAPPNSSDPADILPTLDDTGWMVEFDLWVDVTPDGEHCLRTVPKDLSVKVLGLIDVHLKDFQLDATLIPGKGGEPDRLEGFILTSGGEFGVEGSEMTPLNAIGAALVGTGIPEGDLAGIGKPCDEDPCAHILEAGGTCYIPDDWVRPSVCP